MKKVDHLGFFFFQKEVEDFSNYRVLKFLFSLSDELPVPFNFHGVGMAIMPQFARP